MQNKFNLVVVGGTPGGIACAVRAAREGLTVLLVNHSRHLGGMISSGIGVMDMIYWGNRAPILQEFCQGVKNYYADKYGEDSQNYADCTDGGIKVEPHVGEWLLNKLVMDEPRITTWRECYPVSVERAQNKLIALNIRLFNEETCCRVEAESFIDATYEGDLIAIAGVAYRVGRESGEAFGERYAGKIFTVSSRAAYPREAHEGRVKLGTFALNTTEVFTGSTGEGDRAVQAYNFRVCLSNDPENRKYPEKPESYDREAFMGLVKDHRETTDAKYALKGTLLLEDVNDRRIKPITSRMPNRKMSWNDATLPGGGMDYPEANWSQRKAIIQRHRDHALGLLYFLQNDEAVPEHVRQDALQWGLALDEFVDNEHFPYEMYVREARRMVGRYVFTEHDATLSPGLQRAPIQDDSIAIAEWPMDSHECTVERRYGSYGDGYFTLSEYTRPSQIPYRILLPPDLDNLLVPVCMSSTHVGWGTLRLEPVWMHVGEVAAYAAVLAFRSNKAPASISVDRLQRHLVEQGIMISFFEEFDMDVDHKWAAAVQYLGTKGFFTSYQAKPHDPLTAQVSLAWARMFGDILREKSSANERAKGLASVQMDDPAHVTCLEFVELLNRELAYQGIHDLNIQDALDELGLKPNADIQRGDACRILYQVLGARQQADHNLQ